MSFIFIALRFLAGKSGSKGERYLLGAASGIALSLVPIMVTLIVADGMIRGITDRFLELGTGHIALYPIEKNEDEIPESEVKTIIMNEEGVRAVWQEIDGMGVVLGANGKKGAIVRAVEPDFLTDEGSRLYLHAISGEALLREKGDVLLGAELARLCGVETGGKLRIMTAVKSGGSLRPRSSLWNVRGIVSSGYHEIDAMWCMVSLQDGKKLFASASAAGSEPFYVVKIQDPYNDADTVAMRINSSLDGFFRAFTWKNLQAAQYSSYESTRQLLLFIMALIVLVAAVNVSSASSMLVISRERDIAVLKSFGAGFSYIRTLFLSASVLTAAAGCAVGVFAGLLLGMNINGVIHGLEFILNIFGSFFNVEKIKILDPDFYLETIPVVIEWSTVLFIVFFTIACAFAASFFPATRAAKTKPAAILHGLA